MAFTDGACVEICVDARYPSVASAQAEAAHFAGPLGKLAGFMRGGLDHVVLKFGTPGAFAEADGHFIIVTTGNMAVRRSQHDMDETIFHESVHATLDADYLESIAWLQA